MHLVDLLKLELLLLLLYNLLPVSCTCVLHLQVTSWLASQSTAPKHPVPVLHRAEYKGIFVQQ